jgi:hypothetical protein
VSQKDFTAGRLREIAISFAYFAATADRSEGEHPEEPPTLANHTRILRII